MAMRSNAAILPAFCIWDKRQKYRFIRGAVIEPSQTGDRKADIISDHRRLHSRDRKADPPISGPMAMDTQTLENASARRKRVILMGTKIN